jgi:ribosomal protein S18 acetylase RimI-like enzyme
MKIVISKHSVLQDPSTLSKALFLMRNDMKFLRDSYPHFDNWFFETVIPGISTGDRTIVIETRGETTAGLLILKHTIFEKKLCTLRVNPSFASKGLGVKLFTEAFERLETETPLLSVSEHAEPKFIRIFDHFGFKKQATYNGIYKPFVNEYAFNGLIHSEVRSTENCDEFA